MEKVIIIGGGASGLIAAIYASKKGNEVTILERNNSCGKKLLITGNGRCNYWNEDQHIDHYHSNNFDLLSKIITDSNKEEILSFFDKIGIVPKIKNGYYYPFSNKAVSVQYALLLQAKLCGIEIINNCLVKEIVKKKDKFFIKTNINEITADKVVLATGSKANPKTGSDGIGYELAKSLGHSITNIFPSLVQLRGEERYFKKWNGIRTEVEITLYEDGNKIKKEFGEIQLTNYGISGICVFNLSRYVEQSLSQHKEVYVTINFIPWIKSKNELFDYLNKRNEKVKNRTIGQLLEGILDYKLVYVLLSQANINADKKFDDLTKLEKNKLIENIYSFNLKIIGTNSFEQAQVCSGGISLMEINVKTMESLRTKGLYLVGELLDVDGDCGGYNLSFAWISGMLAGRAIKGECND